MFGLRLFVSQASHVGRSVSKMYDTHGGGLLLMAKQLYSEARIKRIVREVVQAELRPLTVEVRRLRKELTVKEKVKQ